MQFASGEVDLYRVLQVDPAAHPEVIRAAFRALARMLHPDQTRTGEPAAMASVNRAYEILRDPDQRRAYDDRRRGATATAVATPNVPPPPATWRGTRRMDASGCGGIDGGGGGTVLTHGRYTGWTLEQLARQDPDYPRWLGRHVSGLRYRAQINRLLAHAKPA